MDLQPIKPIAAKRGDQAGMDIDDPILKRIDHRLLQHHQESGQHHQINVMGFQKVC